MENYIHPVYLSFELIVLMKPPEYGMKHFLKDLRQVSERPVRRTSEKLASMLFMTRREVHWEQIMQG